MVRGTVIDTKELPAYCAFALAGLNDQPDTIMTRSIVIRDATAHPGREGQTMAASAQ